MTIYTLCASATPYHDGSDSDDDLSSGTLHKLVMNASVLLERRELLRDHVQRKRLRARLRADIVAVAHVDGPAVELLLADDCTHTCTHAKRSDRTHE